MEVRLGPPRMHGFPRPASQDYLKSLGGTRTKGGIESKLKVDPRTFFFDATAPSFFDVIAPAGSAMKARFSGDRLSVMRFFFFSSLLMQKHTAKHAQAGERDELILVHVLRCLRVGQRDEGTVLRRHVKRSRNGCVVLVVAEPALADGEVLETKLRRV